MNQKHSDRLREAIEEDIAMGRLPPGSRIDEAALSERFGVSRTPIREALLLLAQSGLVDVRRRRGTVVADIEPRRLYEMFDVMAELEAMCARLAARRITAAQQRELVDAHAACEAAAGSRDPDAYFHENERFHEAVRAASNNTFLAEEASALHRRLRPYRRLQLRVRDRVDNSFSEHQGIVDAILAGDVDAAGGAHARPHHGAGRALRRPGRVARRVAGRRGCVGLIRKRRRS